MSEAKRPSLSLFDLRGRAAIVTGAASGLGQRMARALAQHGANVVAADLDVDGARRTALAVHELGGKSIGVRIDVTDAQSCAEAVAETVSHFGRLDIGVNAAGVAGGKPGDDNPITIWQHVINVDLSGVYYCCLAQADAMRRSRGNKDLGSSSIVNIASMSADIVNHFPQPPVDESRVLGLASYCAAKAGVKQLTKVLAAQWARDGIRVNCISPGYMATAMTKEIFEMPEVIDQIRSETPLRRVGQPEDLDGAVVFLSSSAASSFVTGAEMLIDGGYTVW